MSSKHCEFEAATLRAVSSGRWDDALREHAASCPDCAEAAFVAHHLQSEAAELDERPLPDPQLLWRRAQIEARFAATRRATRFITVMQVAAMICATGVGLLALTWLWPGIRRAASTLLDTGASAALPSGAPQPGIVLLASFVIVLALVLSEMWTAHTQQ